MASTDDKAKHLELIQAIVTRMAQNSFLLKGWAVTLLSALFALAAKESNRTYAIICYFPLIAFWILDGYFLFQERLYRSLYDSVRSQPATSVDYSMNATSFAGGRYTWACSMFSKTLLIFYGVLIVTTLIVMFGIK